MKDIRNAAKDHMMTLHKRIQEERSNANIEEINRWYSTFYAYLRFYEFTAKDDNTNDFDMKSVLEDAIMFLIQCVEKPQYELNATELQGIYTLLNNFILSYSSILNKEKEG